MFIRFTRKCSIKRQSKQVTKDNSSLKNSQGLLVSKRMYNLAMSNFDAFDKVVKLKIQEYSCNISKLSPHDRKSCKYIHSLEAFTKRTFKTRIDVWNGILLVLQDTTLCDCKTVASTRSVRYPTYQRKNIRKMLRDFILTHEEKQLFYMSEQQIKLYNKKRNTYVSNSQP